MNRSWTRRQFLSQAAVLPGFSVAACLNAAEANEKRKPSEHSLTVISDKPRERGRAYGRQFKDAIHAFLNKEIYQAFVNKPSPRDEILRYAGKCSEAVKDYSPIIFDELEGVAEGAGLKLEEAVLLTLHEELFHGGTLPKTQHCTVLAAGPPDTSDGNTYIGQTWDWMASVYGLSTMLLWKRPEGPSVLAYSYPGLWVGAGVNSAGIAFSWTSAWDKEKIPGPRVGIPSYVLLTQMLYQETLHAAVEEAKRAKQAGWFTSVWADAQGNFANVEVTPREKAVETGRGHMVRQMYGSRQLTRTPETQPVKFNEKCTHLFNLLAGSKGKLNRGKLQQFLGDPGICAPPNDSNFTVDTMLFNTTEREAYVCRGPAQPGVWKTFKIAEA